MKFSLTQSLFACVDPSLGRVSKETLSQHTLMELFVAGIEPKEVLYGESADPPEDVSKWTNLSVDDSKQISAIRWGDMELEGSISWEWLPCVLVILSLNQNMLSGTINLQCLPAKLFTCSLGYNRFFGTVCLTKLPGHLAVLSIAHNDLHGSLDLTKLPDTMQKLYLYENNFNGGTDFSKLPESLSWLDVSSTYLEGEIITTETYTGRTFVVRKSEVRLIKVVS